MKPAGFLQTLVFGVVGLATLCLFPPPAAKAATASDCANLVNLGVENTTITSATLIPAGGGLPEYCRVRGHVDTEIGFEIRLPTNWNGKFYFQGVGALAGTIPPPGNRGLALPPEQGDRKSTRLNSSHSQISYAVFCLKKKKKEKYTY